MPPQNAEPDYGSAEDYFDAIGADWDRLRESFFSDRVRERAIAAARVESGRDAVDLGAGTGFMTRGLLVRGLRVIAVDRSPAMLAALRATFPQPDSVDCRLGDAERLPLADASVDYCFANMVLHHVERPLRAIEEMARILKPGGRVVVTDLESHDFSSMKEEHHDRWMGFEREQIREWLRLAGLVWVQVEASGEECCCSIPVFLACGTKPQTG